MPVQTTDSSTALFCLAVSLGVLCHAATAQGSTYRVSRNPFGVDTNGASSDPSIADDGRSVAFTSVATNLTSFVDGNQSADIFVHETLFSGNTRVSVSSAGVEANGPSRSACLSGNGRFVAFESDATNLVAGDGNGYSDIFLHDLSNSRTTRVSVSSNGMEGDLPSFAPSISDDGRYVAFLSMASNLVANDNNQYIDVFVHDRLTRRTTRANVAANGTEADDDTLEATISGDGSFLAFTTSASNLVASPPTFQHDIYLRELASTNIERVDPGLSGVPANAGCFSPAISDDARFIAFHSSATNLVAADRNGHVDVFRYDRNTNTTVRVSLTAADSEPNADCRNATISDDGRFIAFASRASNMLPRDSFANDVFVRDVVRGRSSVHTLTSDGLLAQEENDSPMLAGCGRFVAFASLDDGLSPADVNGVRDIMIHENRPPHDGEWPGSPRPTHDADARLAARRR